jgi:AraC family L-rhamnose operon transcriptional activator RhaR
MDRMRRAEVFGTAGYPLNSARLQLTDPVPAHAHDFCEVAVICGGAAEYRTRLGRRRLTAGNVVAVRPGSWHAYSQIAYLDVANLYLGSELLGTELSWVLDDPTLTNLLIGSGDLALKLDAAATRRVARWLAELAASRDRDAPAAAVQQRSLLGAVLAELVGSRPIREITPAPDSVRIALSAMADRPQHPWTIEELADLAGVSPSHLHHQFADRLGSSPLRWLNGYRAEQMAVQLVAGTRSVAEIGRSVGWSDPNYATRRFRSAYNLTPSAYRAQFSF